MEPVAAGREARRPRGLQARRQVKRSAGPEPTRTLRYRRGAKTAEAQSDFDAGGERLKTSLTR
jgi:hypothetical protein